MNYLIYQLKVAGILFLFYCIYMLLIKNSSWFHYKRLFLVSSVTLSFLIPFIHLSFQTPNLTVFKQVLPEVIIGAPVAGKGVENVFSFWAFIILFSGTLIFLLKFIAQLLSIYNLIRTSQKTIKESVKVFCICGNEAFTFFRFVFLGNKIPAHNAKVILKHEIIHANRLHSIDIIILELVLLMQWFNPIVWLIRREVQENHEYEADRVLLESGESVELYQQLLLNQMFQTREVRFSSFNYNSFIKNRIKMMKNYNKAGKTRFLLATLMSLLVVAGFACKLEDSEKTNSTVLEKLGDTVQVLENEQQMISKEVSGVNSKEPILVPEKRATFNGKGLEAFNEYVMQNVKYPTIAAKNGIQGKVYVNFVVDTDGKVKEVSILRGVSTEIDNEVIRVLKNSPSWSPAVDKGVVVKQLFTLPVVFKLKE